MRPVEERLFRIDDGIELFHRFWRPIAGATRGAILLAADSLAPVP